MEKLGKTDLIEKILGLELKMFLTVPVIRKAGCQENPDSFRTIRKAQFIVWSKKTLDCYLNDLEKAERDGRNLMTWKYARMDDLILRENRDPLIEKIVSIQYTWQKEMFQKYPYLMNRARPIESKEDGMFQTSFMTYLRGEIETYSHNTLASLYDDISDMRNTGKNMAVEIYRFMVKDLGYDSLSEAEETAKACATPMP